jgi:hypothetical protein
MEAEALGFRYCGGDVAAVGLTHLNLGGADGYT